MKIKLTLAAIALVVTQVASAAVTCTTYGNQTRCSGYDNGKYYSYTCTTYGNQTRCN